MTDWYLAEGAGGGHVFPSDGADQQSDGPHRFEGMLFPLSVNLQD